MFGYVLVTYNRLNKLKITLSHYDDQLERDDMLIVVNNGSDDGTKEYLFDWEKQTNRKYKMICIHMEQNDGGASGFKIGLEKATQLGIDWCMISDDDAYLGNGYIKKLKDCIFKFGNDYSVFCSKVIYPNKQIQYLHRRYLKKGILGIKGISASDSDYSKFVFDINLFSFIGVCIKMSVIEDVGYPDENYFIWYDDTDLSIRINQKYKIGCFTDLVMIHDCGNNGANGIVTFKEYYGYRNRLYTLKKYFDKRYYISYLLLLRLRCISNKRKCPQRVEIIEDAIKGFYRNEKGKNIKYLPNTFKRK